MNYFRKLLHSYSHWVGSNEGDIVSYRDGDEIYIAFKCRTCDRIDGAQVLTLNQKEPNYAESGNSHS